MRTLLPILFMTLCAWTTAASATGNAITYKRAHPVEDAVGEWTLRTERDAISGGLVTTETLRINLNDRHLVGTLTTPGGVKPLQDLVYQRGKLTWSVPTKDPSSNEPLTERQLIMIGPTLHYEGTIHNGLMQGFMRGHFGVAQITGIRQGSGASLPDYTVPASSEAALSGEDFTWLREETFKAGGQSHTVQIYRSKVLAAVLGLSPTETDVSVEFVLVPAGSFLMGSSAEVQDRMVEMGRRRALLKDESPQHRRRLDAFLMARTELTQDLWRGLAHLGGQPRSPSFFENAGGRAPVEPVSWTEVQQWLLGVNAVYGTGLRLPSEAEWEYAARAGVEAPYYNGGFPSGSLASEDLDPIAWYLGNSRADYDGGIRTAGTTYGQSPVAVMGSQPVGLKLPNAFGLHDVLGNVLEWCEDIAHPGYEGAPQDGGPWTGGAWIAGNIANGPMTPDDPLVTVQDGTQVPGRVRRGGSWRNVAQNTRVEMRSFRGPNFVDANTGVRLAASIPDGLVGAGIR
ncbi:MAG: formylglycine-generating enzyme family protein [Alphaproteobacteria bacterium]|nr:formylglycine-generating enzyme family protein [Alphaproteobacteria bacterium]